MKFSVLRDMSVGASACEHFFSTCLVQHLPGSEPGGERKFRVPPTLTTKGGGKRAGASMLEILSRSACSLSVPGVASFGHAAAGARRVR